MDKEHDNRITNDTNECLPVAGTEEAIGKGMIEFIDMKSTKRSVDSRNSEEVSPALAFSQPFSCNTETAKIYPPTGDKAGGRKE
ncbi:hypothetical protein ACNR90_000377 [Candidozyma auris]